MIDFAEGKRFELPSLLPFLMNMALVSTLGAMLNAWLEALLGGGLLSAVLGDTILPIVLIFTIACAVTTQVCQHLESFIHIPFVSILAQVTAAAQSGRCLLLGTFKPLNRSGVALNSLLLLPLSCLAIGIEVAFYAALAAMLIVFLTLAMLALESSSEPERD